MQSNPQMIDLGAFGFGGLGLANDVNNSGQVVGKHWAGGSDHAYLCSSACSNDVPGNPAMTDLGTLGGGWSQGYGINDSGQAVGWAHAAGNIRRAFLWTPGAADGEPTNPKMKDLGTLGISDSSAAWGINNLGQVVGDDGVNDTSKRAWLWTPAGSDGVASNPQMKDLSSFGGPSSARGINNLGQVVGWSSYVPLAN